MCDDDENEDGLPPRIRSERFDIYHHDICRSEANGGLARSVYHAWFHSQDVPFPVCVVTINECFMDYVEWIHVEERYRRQGIATEVLRAIELELGRVVTMDAVTDLGRAFVESYEDRFPSEVE